MRVLIAKCTLQMFVICKDMQKYATIDCPNEWVEAPQTAFERLSYKYNKAQTLASLNCWLKHTSKQLEKHIDHALCRHRGVIKVDC